jgi:hypothetical protein
LLGNSSWKLETSRSSTCWLGSRPTLAYRHISEYKAKVPPGIFKLITTMCSVLFYFYFFFISTSKI